jgi:hypothetical protein
METAGKSRRSSFRNKLLSFTPSAATNSTSDSELVEAPGRSNFGSVLTSKAMVLEFKKERELMDNQNSAYEWYSNLREAPALNMTQSDLPEK